MPDEELWEREKRLRLNPPEHSSKELWRAYWWQCNVMAGFSAGPDEAELVRQNNDVPPSELERMKKATKEEPKK
jgi:hypothetical protein